MSRAPLVPLELTCGPFTVGDALRNGLTRRQLQGRAWRRLATGLYIWSGLADEPRNLLRALRSTLPPGAAFSDRTAAWLHGLDFEPCAPAQATVPDVRGVSVHTAVSLRRSALPDSDVVDCEGLPVTSPVRTVFDLARHLPTAEAVVAADAALREGLVGLEELRAYAATHPTSKGARQARQVIGLADPRAESPMETRLRVLLVLAGLPRPVCQAELTDEHGRFLARVDLYYPSERLALEYDGGVHRDSLAADNRRQNRLLAAGYRLLRFAAADVYSRPDAVVAQVRDALRSGSARTSASGPRSGRPGRPGPASAVTGPGTATGPAPASRTAPS